MCWLANFKTLLIILFFLIIISCSTKYEPISNHPEELVIINTHEILATEILKPDKHISTDCESYTFFLFPYSGWIRKYENKIKELKSEFNQFGQSIGEKNLAIWFADEKGKTDVNRSLDFVRMLDLNQNSGPFIIFIHPKQPELWNIILHYSNKDSAIQVKIPNSDLQSVIQSKDFSDMFIINFDNIEFDCALKLLNSLKCMLRTNTCDLSEIIIEKNICEIQLITKKIGIFGEKFLKILSEIRSKTGISIVIKKG